jgi:hypothetical protein
MQEEILIFFNFFAGGPYTARHLTFGHSLFRSFRRRSVFCIFSAGRPKLKAEQDK